MEGRVKLRGREGEEERAESMKEGRGGKKEGRAEKGRMDETAGEREKWGRGGKDGGGGRQK